MWVVGAGIWRLVASNKTRKADPTGTVGALFTRPQAGADEANRRRRLLGRVGDFSGKRKVTYAPRSGERNSPKGKNQRPVFTGR